MIRFENAKIGYTDALLEIETLELKSGGIYALVGSNGSGKSTLLNSIIGKQKLINGSIYIEKKDASLLNARQLSTMIAYVESKFDGVDYLKVKDYVALGRTPYTDAFGRLTAEDQKIVSEAITTMNLEHFSERFTTQLSDGERQLAATARALAQTTSIIILDEPTAFLDYGNRKKLIEMLSRISKESGKCVIFSTHDIDLCIEQKLELLIIDQKENSLRLFDNEVTKKELLEIGFGIRD